MTLLHKPSCLAPLPTHPPQSTHFPDGSFAFPSTPSFTMWDSQRDRSSSSTALRRRCGVCSLIASATSPIPVMQPPRPVRHTHSSTPSCTKSAFTLATTSSMTPWYTPRVASPTPGRPAFSPPARDMVAVWRMGRAWHAAQVPGPPHAAPGGAHGMKKAGGGRGRRAHLETISPRTVLTMAIRVPATPPSWCSATVPLKLSGLVL